MRVRLFLFDVIIVLFKRKLNFETHKSFFSLKKRTGFLNKLNIMIYLLLIAIPTAILVHIIALLFDKQINKAFKIIAVIIESILLIGLVFYTNIFRLAYFEFHDDSGNTISGVFNGISLMHVIMLLISGDLLLIMIMAISNKWKGIVFQFSIFLTIIVYVSISSLQITDTIHDITASGAVNTLNVYNIMFEVIVFGMFISACVYLGIFLRLIRGKE